MMILGFAETAPQSQALSARLGCAHALVDVHRFPDGESRLRLPPALPESLVLFRTLDRPNDKLVELLLAAGAARTLGARHITLVAPYLCYMRQDMAFVPGEAVSQRLLGRWLAREFEAVVTVDPHLHRVATLAEAVPAARALALTAAGPLGDWVLANCPDAVLLGPDAESAQWVAKVAAPGGLAYGVATKERHGDRDVAVHLPDDLPVAGRTVVLVDDVISSGHTLMEAARGLRARGAARIIALATHGLFAEGALAGMAAAGIDAVHTTDAIPGPHASIALAGLLAEALRP